MIHHHHYRKDRGAVLLDAILALFFLSLLFGIAFVTVREFAKLRESVKARTEALIHAVNVMEALKIVEYPVPSLREEEGFVVRWNVQEFTPATFLLEVSVENEKGRRILSLRTLRKKGISTP